jgi:hypothetical protein
MNSYVLIFDHSVVPRQQMLQYIDTLPFIRNWRASTGAIFLASEWQPHQIYAPIHERFPNLHFVVSKVDRFTTQGWTDQETWDFLNNPKPWPGR